MLKNFAEKLHYEGRSIKNTKEKWNFRLDIVSRFLNDAFIFRNKPLINHLPLILNFLRQSFTLEATSP